MVKSATVIQVDSIDTMAQELLQFTYLYGPVSYEGPASVP